MIRPDWTPPAIPDRFDQLCAFEYPDGEIVLDFVSHERRDFASEEIEVEISWPWVTGATPSPRDWDAIGFYFLSAKPCPYRKTK